MDIQTPKLLKTHLHSTQLPGFRHDEQSAVDMPGLAGESLSRDRLYSVVRQESALEQSESSRIWCAVHENVHGVEVERLNTAE